MSVRLLIVVACALALWPAPGKAECPTRSSWPTDAWPSRAAQVRVDRAAEIRALEDYAFTLTGKDEDRLGLRTDALLIVRDGEILYERYARGWDATRPHLAWSVTKSFTSALTGVAVQRGAVAVSDSMCRHLTAQREEQCAITLQHLLEFSSGIDWREAYENEPYQVSSVIAMFFGEGKKDAIRFITSHPLRDPPGTTWEYSTGDSTLLASAVDAAMRPAHGEAWPWDLLFDPIGARSVTIERDPQGNLYGGSYLYATAQDYARFGYLYLNDGCWAGQRLLPEDWVRRSTAVAPVFRAGNRHANTEANGWQWWLNQPVPEVHIASPPWAGVPVDAYAAQGHWGQYVVVIPSLEMVVVRLGDDRNDGVDLGRLISLSMAVAQ
jgi:CubicO group peptidase (beta-lactamase class C family)